MLFIFTFLAIVLLGGVLAITLWKRSHAKHVAQLKLTAKTKHGWTEDKIADLDNAEKFPVPSWTRSAMAAIAFLFLGIGMFHSIFFYAEPGYKYHVRTIFGEERVIDDVGYAYYAFGRYNAWKKAMTVQSTITSAKAGAEGDVTAEGEETTGTASLPQQTVVMLDQVDAKVSATVRFRLPSDKETFLKLVHEYRTPVNLIRAALIPAFQETLQANGSLMGAEEFYSGGRTQFNAEFDNQMQGGVYLVKRKEVVVQDDVSADANATAASNLGENQARFGDNKRVRFEVEKLLGPDGQPLRKRQKFTDFGISVVETRVTDLEPNKKFVERMQLKQQAAADRAIAREKRVQEEEQKLLVIAKGDREIAEQQAEAKKAQITQTTNADTSKQLALIEASKGYEQAEIDKKTAKVTKERADIDAQRIKVLADADKYEREMRIKGDNALDKKLAAEIEIQKVWADAFAKRQVPANVFVSGTEGSTPVGGDTEVKRFLQLMTLDAAKRLNYDRSIDEKADAPAAKK